MADTFQYGTLSAEDAEIRLLRVKPSDDSNADRAINYNLETTALPRYGLQKTPEYYAVSYAWGDELQKTPIRVDGRELMVPLNTAKALESIQSMLSHLHTGRDHSKDVRIWIDAVCINQSDRDERAEQVSRMKDIYEKALSVIIWLGDHASPDEAKAAFESVHNIYETSMHWYGGASFSPADSRDIHGMLGDAHPPSDDRWHDLYSSVAPVYTSTWFERLWTIQESGLARKAWCILQGGILPLYEITIVAAALTAPLYHRTPETLRGAARGLELANARGKVKSLVRSGLFFPTIKAVMGYSASDPRDMVYGVLGLVSGHCGSIPMVVDYTCPVQELFARTTVQSVILSQSLEPLQIAAIQSDDGANDGFPSWAMRLDRGKKTTLDPLRPQFESPKHRGTWVFRVHEIPINTKWKILRLKGAILDEVTCALKLDCLPEFSDDRFIDSIFSIHSAISAAKEAVASESPIIDSEDTLPSDAEDATGWADTTRSSVACILAAGLYANNENHVQRNVKYMEKGQADLERYRGQRDQINPKRMDGWIRKALRLSFRQTKCFQRAFFITKGGRMGLGPLTTLLGDQVCVFSSGCVPFVLRQQGASWRLVGDAYVHGLDQEKQWTDLATQATGNERPEASNGGISESFSYTSVENSEPASHNDDEDSQFSDIACDERLDSQEIQLRHFDIQ